MISLGEVSVLIKDYAKRQSLTIKKPQDTTMLRAISSSGNCLAYHLPYSFPNLWITRKIRFVKRADRFLFSVRLQSQHGLLHTSPLPALPKTTGQMTTSSPLTSPVAVIPQLNNSLCSLISWECRKQITINRLVPAKLFANAKPWYEGCVSRAMVWYNGQRKDFWVWWNQVKILPLQLSSCQKPQASYITYTPQSLYLQNGKPKQNHLSFTAIPRIRWANTGEVLKVPGPK